MNVNQGHSQPRAGALQPFLLPVAPLLYPNLAGNGQARCN
jgi:hypothetical protein